MKNELQHLCLNKGVQRKHKLWSEAGQQMLRELPLKAVGGVSTGRLARDCWRCSTSRSSRWTKRCKQQRNETKCAARCCMTQPGVGPNTALAYVLTMGDVQPVSTGQAGGELSGADSARASVRADGNMLGAIIKQGNRMLRMLLVEAATDRGSSAIRSFGKSICIAVIRSRKAVAKVAAARKLAVRLYWMLRTQAAVSGDRSHREQPAGAPGRRKLDRRIDWALSHPVGTGCSHRRIMVEVQAESMVGGTIEFHRRVIQREISRVLVLNLSGKQAVLKAPHRISLSLTAPSLLSRGTRLAPARDTIPEVTVHNKRVQAL